MKFGKHIQAQTIPEWAAHYMNYKALKKIINELSAPLTPSLNPSEASKQRLQTVKAAFFFQVDRELEKVNSFYLQKEADLKVRLKSLIEKQRALRSRGPRNRTSTIRALREAFLNSRRDLDKLQNFVEINATGFRKILKKWDKRSKSSTKELYLARQVDVQPCFNQDVIAEFSDTVTKCLSELEHALEEYDPNNTESTAITDSLELAPSPSLRSALYSQPQPQPQPQSEPQSEPHKHIDSSDNRLETFAAARRRSSTGFLLDSSMSSSVQIDRMEAEVFQALLLEAKQPIRDTLARLASQNAAAFKACVTRVLWRACSEIKDPEKQQLLLELGAADLKSADDINERTLAHEATIHGTLLILQAAIGAGVAGDESDYYGRRPAHYAALNGHSECLQFLLDKGCYTASAIDDDGCRAFDYAVSSGHSECVRLLLNHDKDVIADCSPENPVLILACEKGHESIVLLLLEAGAQMLPNVQGVHPAHVAARTGLVAILKLLLEHGAPVDVADKDLVWTPVFYAASEGNIECIRILIDAGCDVELVDENNRPAVYYAANEGHLESVDLLLDAARRSEGSKRESTDGTIAASVPDIDNSVGIDADIDLQQHQQQNPVVEGAAKASATAATAAEDGVMADLDLDGIPSLSLPPPLIPFRVYGHNFLGKRTRIQIRMQTRNKISGPPVAFFDSRDMMSLKLVTIAKPDAGVVPHTVMLPLETASTTFGFQTDDLAQFRLELFLYPSFGLQPIGKAVALPSLFNRNASSGIARLPLLDRYLRLVAEVTFEFLVVRPLEGAPLQIGGKVETYWKSTNPGPRQSNATGNATGSMHQSPLAAATLRTPLSSAAIASPLSAAEMGTAGYTGGLPLVVSSSLAAEHVCIQVQVCRDGVPVVSPRICIDIGSPSGVKLSICSLTHSEFQQIMRSPSIKQTPRRHNTTTNAIHDADVDAHKLPARPDSATGTAAEWYRYVQDSGFTLKEVLDILPPQLGVSIQVLYNSRAWTGRGAIGGGDSSIAGTTSSRQDVNDYVDSILKTVYDDSLKRAQSASGFRKEAGEESLSPSAEGSAGGSSSILERVASGMISKEGSQRNTIFCSYSPQVCIALNWKQPNYAVFLLTSGREPSAELESVARSTDGDVHSADAPSFSPPSNHLSLKEAVRFACNNNLLGLICNSSLLTRVPELIKSIKHNGLFLISFGRDNYDEQSCTLQKTQGVDAIMRAGVIRYDADENIEFAI
ncbi:phosphate system positive regulatory protein pho81 [Coemansia asiatica]|uniref:Phosphate system positive regulatory protein pho81 n=1 Tax=Coemansia asiatica TaxID=1052880 RepID=A0A9W8CI28_9FUNG|nr:phosphate system positive regulatory protein pho81 [Coemansia asiatica]